MCMVVALARRDVWRSGSMDGCVCDSDQKRRTSSVLARPGCDTQPQVAVDAMRTCVSPLASNWRPLRILHMNPPPIRPLPPCMPPPHDDDDDDKKNTNHPRLVFPDDCNHQFPSLATLLLALPPAAAATLTTTTTTTTTTTIHC